MAAEDAAVYFYVNVGVEESTFLDTANAYFYANIGVEQDQLVSKGKDSYFYGNVVFGGEIAFVSESIFKVTKLIAGSGGYGTRAYGTFRYGMGEPFAPAEEILIQDFWGMVPMGRGSEISGGNSLLLESGDSLLTESGNVLVLET